MVDIVTTPLLTARDTAAHLEMPESTLDLWLASSSGRPLVHSVKPERRGWPRVPFVGVIEAYVLRTLRDLGASMSEIRAVAEIVRDHYDDPFALASRKIAHDGVSVFAELADKTFVNQHSQTALREAIEGRLKFIEWDDSGRPMRLRLSQYPLRAEVVIDPRFGWGRPVLASTKVPVSAVVDLWHAGESMDVVASEFNLDRDVVEDILRVAA